MFCEQVFRLKKNGEPYKYSFCRHPELIENYEKAIADTTQTWEVHHRREDTFSQKELIERGEYFDVSPEELIFLTPTEHRKIDSARKRVSKSLSKKVLCVETSEVYESAKEASRKTCICNIDKACRGGKTAGGYHWRYI